MEEQVVEEIVVEIRLARKIGIGTEIAAGMSRFLISVL
jgi:hypothetical protein